MNSIHVRRAIQFALCGVAWLLAGCAETVDPGHEGVAADGSCPGTYPDGTRNDCQQHAEGLRGSVDATPYVCKDQSVPGPQGTVRLVRHLVSGGAALSLDLSRADVHGVAFLEDAPERLWAWHGAAGDETWELGVTLEAGQRLNVWIYSFTVADANDASGTPSIEQHWSTFQDQPYAIHRIAFDDSEYFLDRMLHVERENETSYVLAPFESAVGPHWFVGDYEAIIRVALTEQTVPGCGLIS